MTAPEDLPGADLVASGIDALRRGEWTVEALLVAVGARRLRAAGLEVPRVPELPDGPELALYAAVAAAHPRDAHSRYNGLVRRLVSFERALERSRRRQASGRGLVGRDVGRQRDGADQVPAISKRKPCGVER